jgi:hypothetical protein
MIIVRSRAMARPLAIVGALALAMGSLGAAFQPEPPEWAHALLHALLNEQDVGPDLERSRQEFRVQGDISAALVFFERARDGTPDSPSVVGSLLMQVEGGLMPGEFDVLANLIVSPVGGMQPVVGPPLGEEARWFAGSSLEGTPPDEAHILVARMGTFVLSIVLEGPVGTVSQDAAAEYASVVTERLDQLPLGTWTAEVHPT